MYALARADLVMKPEEDEGEPEGDEDVGLNFPFTYVQRTYMQNRKHGTFPFPGGYNQQPKALMDDWAVIDRRYNKAYDDLKRHKDGSGALDDLINGKDDEETGTRQLFGG